MSLNPKDLLSRLADMGCKQDTLEFVCTCANGSAPGLEYYTQTMPTVSDASASNNHLLARMLC